MAIDGQKLDRFMNQAVGELGAVANTALVLLGERLGLYKAMAGAGPITSAELANKTGTTERYVREWLSAQAAGGYVDYDPAAKTFTLPEEHAVALAQEDSPAYLPGGFQVCVSMIRDMDKMERAFRTGNGFPWHDHDPWLFEGTQRFFRANYIGNLVNSWIPALDGVEAKLKAGASVADIGCGWGASTILMAQAYPNSRFVGFDYHEASIDAARKAARKAGVMNRVTFQAAPAKSFPGTGYDLVAFFDCLHDMGDPVSAAAHVKQALAPDGVWMVVEPRAGDRLEDNLNPVGRIFYAASTMVCTGTSLSQEVGMALGAQAGEGRLRDVLRQGGFTRIRRAAETPFNMVLEVRP